MLRSSSELPALRATALTIASTLAVAAITGRAHAQDAEAAASQGAVQSAEVSLARNDATLRLELADGRTLDVVLRDGRVLLNGDAVGEAQRGGALDRAWRELLQGAMDASADALPAMLVDWNAPSGSVGERLDAALEALFDASAAVDVTAEAEAQAADVAASAQRAADRQEDSIRRLNREIRDLRMAEAARARPRGPFRSISEGIGSLMELLITYTVLFGIGLAVIFFGGRRYVEGVADTARHATVRSFLVGLAGACLTIPAFVLGIIALAISIVGIPALLAWVPLYPVAVVMSILLGYLGVAHAAGESLAERRFYTSDWFRRGNSYYFLLTGLGVLLGLFIASSVVQMAGPWLGFFRGLFHVLGVLVTLVAAFIGFGAVLISRAGTRPIGADGQPDLFSESSNV